MKNKRTYESVNKKTGIDKLNFFVTLQKLGKL